MSNPNQKSGNAKVPKKTKQMYLARQKKKPTVAEVQTIARKEAKKQINKEVESKSLETYNPAYNNSWNGVATRIFNLPQGDNDGQLTGIECRPTHVRIKGVITVNGATSTVCRVILMQHFSGTPPAANLLLDSAATGTVSAPTGFYNEITQNSYKILFDEFYTIVPATESAMQSFDIRVKADKLRKCYFSNTAGASQKGDLVLYTYSSVAVGESVLFSSRVFYKDA